MSQAKNTTTAEMTWRVLHPGQIDAGTLQRWTEIAQRATHPNPSLEPAFVLLGATHLAAASQLSLLLVYRQGALVAVVPLVPQRQLGPIRVANGMRLGWHETPLGEPSVEPGCEEVVADALLDYVRVSGIAWIRLGEMDANGPLVRAIAARASKAPFKMHRVPSTRGFVTKRPDVSYVTDEGHANLGRLRRQRRAFERAAGVPVTVVDRRDDPNAIDRYLELEASGWKGREGIAFLSREGGGTFLRELAARFRDEGRLRLWSLEAGERVLAMKLNLESGSLLSCYYTTYDESESRLSPGLQLEVENFDLFHADARVSAMDSCAGENNRFANRLYPERRELVTLTIGHGFLGRLLVRLLPAAKQGRKSLRSWRQRRDTSRSPS